MKDYMLQEIEEQPKVLKQLIVEDKEKIYETVTKIIAKNNINKIVLTGSGDSYCAALTNEYAFAESGISTFALYPMEFSRYKYRIPNFIDEQTLLIPISVSGRTPRVVEAVYAAKSKGAHVLAITNNPDSPVAELSNEFLYAKSSDMQSLKTTSYEGETSSKYVGYEHDVPQTKSYSAVQMTLQLMAMSLQKDPDYSELEQIPTVVKKIINNTEIKSLAIEHASSRQIYSASGPNYGNAVFGEFKMYEFSLTGFSKEIEEYCHTAYFVTEEGTSIMFIAPEGESIKRVAEISPVLKNTTKADPIVLSNEEPNFDLHSWIDIPFNGKEEYSIIPYGVVASLYAYWIAKENGLNVNTFRGGLDQEKYVEGSYHIIRKSKIKKDF